MLVVHFIFLFLLILVVSCILVTNFSRLIVMTKDINHFFFINEYERDLTVIYNNQKWYIVVVHFFSCTD